MNADVVAPEHSTNIKCPRGGVGTIKLLTKEMRISKKTVSKKDPMCQRCPCPVWFNLDVGKYEAKSMEDQRDHALGTGQAYEGRMPSLINSLGKILLPALEHTSAIQVLEGPILS